MKLWWLSICIVIIVSACNSTQKPVENLATVTLLVPKPLTQGFSEHYNQMKVDIYRGDETVVYKTVGADSPSNQITLPVPQNYRFETSLFMNNEPVAWGVTRAYLQSSTSLQLSVATLAKVVEVYTPIYTPKEHQVQLNLRVLGSVQWGSRLWVSPEDYTVSGVGVKGGKVVTFSKLGFVIEPESETSPVSVEVSVDAQTAPGQTSTLKLETPFTFVPADLVAGNAMSLNIELQNLPLPGIEVSAAVSTSPNSTLELFKAKDSKQPLVLPSGVELANRGLLKPSQFLPMVGEYCPMPAKDGVLLSEIFLSWSKDSKPIAAAWDSPPLGITSSNYWPYVNLTKYSLIFSNQETLFKWHCEAGGGRSVSDVNLDLKEGWNWVKRTFSGGSMSFSSSTKIVTDNASTPNRTWFAGASDASLLLSANPTSAEVTKGFSFKITSQPGNLYYANMPSVLALSLRYNPEVVKPTSESGRVNSKISMGSYCEWALNASDSGKIDIKCSHESSVPLEFEIPMVAKSNSQEIAATAQIESTTYYDFNTENNKAEFSFLPTNPYPGLTVDTEAPQISSFYTSDSVRVGQIVSLKGQVWDNTEIKRVEIYDGLILLGQAGLRSRRVAATLSDWSFAWIPTREGSITLLALAYDVSGNAAGKQLVVQVDPKAP